MYPVCFTRNTKMKTSVAMVLKPIEAFGGNLKIQGDRADNLDIPATPATAGDDKATITNATCQAPFPNYVTRYDTLDITWSLSTDGGQTWQQVGTSKNETFITRVDPECDTLYRTVAYLACVVEGAQEEGEALTNTWSAFTPVTGDDDVRAWNEETDGYDRPLYYWQTAGDPDNPDDPDHPVSTVPELLETTNGNCDAWTRLFREALRVNGADVDRIHVRPYHGIGPDRWLVVKHVQFLDKIHPEPWPYDDVDTSAQGIPGQNMATPAEKVFRWHFVSRYLIEDPESHTYYDPSYGETYESEQDFTQTAIAGWGQGPLGGIRYRSVGDKKAQFAKVSSPTQ
jgi:hypothetical protein